MLQEPSDDYKEREQWFIDRIEKVVYRNAGTCTCEVCKAVEKNGLRIFDKQHATYLHDVEGCSAIDDNGVNRVRYFDTREEVTLFEKQLKEEACATIQDSNT